jgi:hypothetical protein
MNRNRVLAFAVAILPMTSASADSPFDFRCDDVQLLVDIIENGPNAVVRRLQRRREDFIHETLSGWKCSTDPFPPERNGRVYVEGVVCEATDDIKSVTDANFQEAGEIFKRNLDKFYSCFGDDLINETPKTYVRTSRGEGILGMLTNRFHGHHLIVEYGYFWDSTLHIPIVWTTRVTYAAAGN